MNLSFKKTPLTKNLSDNWERFLVNTIFPPKCYGCGSHKSYLCNKCTDRILLPHSICPHCSKRLPFGNLSKTCKKKLGLNRLFTCSNYKNTTVKTLVTTMKYKSAYALSECLADIAYSFLLQEEVIEDIILENIVIIPVPSYYKKTKRRGFNPADKIAEHLADYLEATTNIKTLIKIKKTKAQVETRSKKEREENLKNAFSTNKNTDLKKNVVLLVDDVITTGSTMRECSKALKKAGVKEIWGIAIARD